MPEDKDTINRILRALVDLTDRRRIDRKDYAYGKFADEYERNEKIAYRTFDRFIADLKKYVPLKSAGRDGAGIYVVDHRYEARKTEMLELFKKIQVNENEMLFFYCFVRSMVESSYFFPPVNPAGGAERGDKSHRDFDHILRIIKKAIPHNVLEFSDKVEYYVSGHYDVQNRLAYNDIFARIFRSLSTERVLTFAYRGERVEVEPLKIVYYNGKWYLMALLLGREGAPEVEGTVIRNYNFSKIKNPHLVNRRYWPRHDDIVCSFRDSFGIFLDEDVKKAVINIYGTAAEDAASVIWHESQSVRAVEGKIGERWTEITLDYPEKGSVELISRVLSYGQYAEVVSPVELRDQWLDELKAAGKRYLKK